MNVCRLKPCHETFIWQDEEGEPFSQIPTERLPRIRNQYTSTEDLDSTHTTILGLPAESIPEQEPGLNFEPTPELPPIVSEAIYEEEPNVSHNPPLITTNKKVRFRIPDDPPTNRSLRPRNTLKQPNRFLDYEMEDSGY